MTATLRPRPWLTAAGLFGLALLLSGSYCSWRNYYVPGTLQNLGSGTQTTIGPVGGFASVFVNGTEFADSAASFTVDGSAAAEGTLRIGQIATITGTSANGSTGTASAFAVRTKLRGPVTAIDLAAATVTVLGQTVQITGDTSVGGTLSPTDPGGLALDSVIAVDGYRTSTGLIASRLDLAATGQTFTVAGPVSNLAGTTQTFAIGATTVDYSGVSGGLQTQLADGTYVVATGATFTAPATLKATAVTVETEVTAGASGTNGSVHGAITRFGSSSDFDVGGQTVATTATTSFLEGASSDLAPDVEVEVAGQYDANGTLTASTVTLVPSANVRVAGLVASLDLGAQTLVVDGITLAATAETRWDDRSAVALRTFGFAGLNSGDWVIVRGVAASGALAATARIVERWPEPAPALAELQDVASNVAAPLFTLTGVSVDSSGAAFTDVNGVALTAANFFAQAGGRLVRARGTLASSGALLATTIALRD